MKNATSSVLSAQPVELGQVTDLTHGLWFCNGGDLALWVFDLCIPWP